MSTASKSAQDWRDASAVRRPTEGRAGKGLDEERRLMPTYSKAANRQASEISRLAQHQRDELARTIRAARKVGFDRLEQTRLRQTAQRADDVAQARGAITAPKWHFELRPPVTPKARRLDRYRVEKMAVYEVNTANAQEIAVIKAEMKNEVSAAIDSFLGQQPKFAAERASIDLSRASWAELRAATRYDGHCERPARSAGDHEHER